MGKRLIKIVIIVALLMGFSNILHAQTVAAGLEYSVVVRADGSVWVWGENQLGQLGDNSREGKTVPSKVQGLPLIQTVSTGAYHTLALTSDGSVWSWGGNKFGQLGNGDQTDGLTAQLITGLPPIVAISAGFYHSLALADDGSVWSWGDNSIFQLGINGSPHSSIPQKISTLINVSKIASSLWNNYAMTADGNIFWWGQDPSGKQPLSEVLPFNLSWLEIIPNNMVASQYTDNATGEQLLMASGMEHNVVMLSDGTVTRSGRNVGESLSDVSIQLKNDLITWMGAVTVNILPIEAQKFVFWRVAGGDWVASGDISVAADGYQTIEFVGNNEWAAPESQSLLVVEGSSNMLDATSTLNVGAVQVNITPQAAADDGAMWRLEGGAWQASGSVLNNLTPGDYSIEFSEIVGWDAPLLEQSTITVTTDNTVKLVEEYAVLTSAVNVIIAPSYASADGAMWRIAGQAWRNSGEMINNLTPGVYSIEFLSTPSWQGGEPVQIDVKQGTPYSFTHTYKDVMSSISVNVFPADAVAEGGQWRINGGVWNNSGVRVGDLASGRYQVEYAPIVGWSVEGVTQVTVNAGDGVVLNTIYRRDTGNVRVTLIPAAAIDAGVQWRLLGGAWKSSGEQINELAPGTYYIEFSKPAGWSTGVAEAIVIDKGRTAYITRRYQDVSGSLQLSLLPLAFAESGGQWRLVGGEWNSSDDLISGVPAGDYVVEFSLPDGWTGINQKSVTVSESITLQESQTFDPLTGRVQVTLSPQQAIDAGALWRVNKGAWHLSDEIEADLMPGAQIIEFSAVDGWTGAAQAELNVQHSTTLNYQNLYELDTDNDSIPNQFDLDDDADGISDEFELANGLDPLDASDATMDWDGDGISNLDEYIAGSNLTQDSLAPQLTVPSDQVVSARGYFTWIDLGVAEAFDILDGILPADASLDAPFKAGRHNVIWQSQDAAGNKAQAQQTVAIIPQLNFAPDQFVVEGDTAVVDIHLSGVAADYPVEVEYKITGDASIDDHDAQDGTVIIGEGEVSASISFNLWSDRITEPNEQVVIELVSVRNAVPGAKLSHGVTIAEKNLPANVTLQAYQGGKAVTTLVKDGGAVEVNALLNDASDLHHFEWGGSDESINSIAQINGGSLQFDPNALNAGNYQLSIVVTDVGTPQHLIAQTLDLRLLAETPLFSASQDSDGDGIDDVTEGLDDSDSDGIAAYLDAETQQPILPLMGIQDPSLVMGAEAGLSLALGSRAMMMGGSMPYLLESDVAEDQKYDYPSGLYDFTINGIATHGDSALVVIPQIAVIPEDAIYRVYRNGGWHPFVSNAHNGVSSAAAIDGFCAAVGDKQYSEGLTAGDQCLQLYIEDGGVNDSDGSNNGSVSITGGTTKKEASHTPANNPAAKSPASGSGGGCSVGNGDSADHTLPILLLLSLLYLWRRRQQRA